LTASLKSNTILQLDTLIRISTAQAVVNYISKKIQDGILKLGEPLPSERALMKELGISRFSLREGLARLSALGLVNIHQGKGAFVATEVNSASLQQVFLPVLSGSEKNFYKDLFVARRIIEQETSQQAAEKRSKKDLAMLEEIVEKSSAILDDPAQFGALDFAFHSEIARIGNNVFLIKMLEFVHGYIRSFLLEHAKDRSSREIAYIDHLEILACIKKRHTHRIRQVMNTHLQHCKENYERHLT